MNQNRLEHIPAGIDQLVSIRTLDLGENRISNFITSPSSADDSQRGGSNGGKFAAQSGGAQNAASKVFHRLSALYGLRLAGNRLQEIPAQIFQVFFYSTDLSVVCSVYLFHLGIFLSFSFLFFGDSILKPKST